jgi:hypothetical protein
LLSLSLVPLQSDATVTHTWTGTIPSTSTEVSVSADFTLSGDTLVVVLSNVSASSTANPADLLTSVYFDIQNGLGDRPTLTYNSAIGDVYMAAQTTTDALVGSGADLKAVAPGDYTWQFRSGLSLPAGEELLSFGIGTAGNSSLDPNNFNGNIVGGFDYGIYAGDIDTRNLDGTLLVNGTAVFEFFGLSGFTEADLGELVRFGFGTQPELMVTAPEPGTSALVGLGLLALSWTRRRSAVSPGR